MVDYKSLHFRKTLSIPNLLKIVRTSFDKIADTRKKKSDYEFIDILMSGLAIFGLKCPSLLDFHEKQKEKRVKHNLKQLYGINETPCNTQLGNVLDKTNPKELRPVTVDVIQELQRQGILESYRYLNYMLISLDATGSFSSNTISCPQCCEKHHRNGKVTYYHQMLIATIVHPNKPTVLPLLAEPITKEDGAIKNDCELSAAKRLIPDLRKMFPRLKMTILVDSLYANDPFIKMLKYHGFKFIIRYKQGNTKILMNEVHKKMQENKTEEFEEQGKDSKNNDVVHGYRSINGISLNAEHKDTKVNYLDYWEIDSDGKEKNFTWITDMTLSRDNVFRVMRAGRSRWKIENETFNTLKNLGYHFEHNYGHGKQYLATVFTTLMLLAFLLDQVQELCCCVFQAARDRFRSRTAFWEKLRSSVTEHFIENWQILYNAIIYGHKGGALEPDYPDTS